MSNEWEIVRLGDEFLLQMGKTPDRQNVQYWNDGTNKWISIADIDGSKYLNKTKETISDIALKESGIKQIPQNTVIMSFKLSIGKVCITKDKIYSNEAIMAFIPKVHKSYDTSFLYYRLLSHNWTLGLNKAVKGITLNKASLNDSKISVPTSLERQREIAEVLDKASELVEKRKAQLAELDRLAESIFYDMFGDPVNNEKGWKISQLSDLGSLKNGLNFAKNESGNITKILGIPDFKNNKCISSHCITADVLTNDIVHSDYLLCNEDLVFVRSNGSKDLVGRCVIVYIEDEAVTFSGFCIRFRNESDIVTSKYLISILSNSDFRLNWTSEGRGCNISNINQQMLKNLVIPIPPLALQQQFAERIEKIEEQKAKVETALKESENLFQRLMQDMFNPDYHNS